MRRATRLLLLLVLVAVLVPLVPFLLVGARLDRIVAGWLDPPPPLPVVAALEVGVLACDLLLPVPSSVVATYGGARLGPWLGSFCAWLGMTIGALAGWWLGRRLGGRALENLEAEDRSALGTLGRDELPLSMLVALVVPVALVWGVVRGRSPAVTPGPPPSA